MGHHYHVRVRVHGCGEGNYLAVQQFVPGLFHIHEFVMGIALCISVAREVFGAAHYSRFVQTLYLCGHHARHKARVAAEGAIADDDVVGVCVHIAHGYEVQIEAVLLQIRADGLSHAFGIFKIPRGADGGHALVFCHIEALGIGDAGYAAALLVDAHDRGDYAGVFKV